MRTGLSILAGVGFLIGAYLFITNYTGTTRVITALGEQSTKAVRTLQGRD